MTKKSRAVRPLLCVCFVVWACLLAVGGQASLAGDEAGDAAGGRGFAGLGGEASGFAQVRPGSPLRFPADLGQHPNFRIEWWYVTANLTDEEGAPFGVQWTLFRQALAPEGDVDRAEEGRGKNRVAGSPWLDRQVWMAHAAATSRGRHVFESRLARGGTGQADVKTEPFRAWLDNWAIRAEPDAEKDDQRANGLEKIFVSAEGDSFAYELQLEAEGPIIAQGDDGYHIKAASNAGAPQASYYYSQPHFRASGTLTLDGRVRRVTGRAWLDREWSSQPLSPHQIGWDWFSLHFQGGGKLMVYRLRRSDGAPPDIGGTWVGPDGAAVTLDPAKLRITPIGEAEEGRAPRVWRIQAPGKGIDVEASALNSEAWIGGVFPYWEGPIVFSGTHNGVGYLEMTGYKR